MEKQERKARKEYQCLLCLQKIKKGEKYIRTTMFPHEDSAEYLYSYGSHINCERFYEVDYREDGFNEALNDYNYNSPDNANGCLPIDWEDFIKRRDEWLKTQPTKE